MHLLMALLLQVQTGVQTGVQTQTEAQTGARTEAQPQSAPAQAAEPAPAVVSRTHPAWPRESAGDGYHSRPIPTSLRSSGWRSASVRSLTNTLWQGDFASAHIRPIRGLTHHEFLEQVTPDLFRATAMYPCCDVLPAVNFLRKKLRSSTARRRRGSRSRRRSRSSSTSSRRKKPISACRTPSSRARACSALECQSAPPCRRHRTSAYGGRPTTFPSGTTPSLK